MSSNLSEEVLVITTTMSTEQEDDSARFRSMKDVNDCWRTAMSILLGVSTVMLTFPLLILSSLLERASSYSNSWSLLVASSQCWLALLSWGLLLNSFFWGLNYFRVSAKGIRRATGGIMKEPWGRMSFDHLEQRLNRSFRISALSALGGTLSGVAFGLFIDP